MKIKRIRNPKFSKVYEILIERERVLFYYHNKDFKIVVYNLGIDSINLWDKCMEGHMGMLL